MVACITEPRTNGLDVDPAVLRNEAEPEGGRESVQKSNRFGVSSEKDQTNTFGADIRLEEKDTEWTIWATINAADDQGISIDDIRSGDKVTIESISGVTYFAGQAGWWTFLRSGVRMVAEGAALPMSVGRIASVIDALERNQNLSVVPGEKDSSKPRDGFGRNLDNGNYAKEEGGVVICGPKASGPMYAHEKNHPRDDTGRTKDQLKEDSEMKYGDCFFAMRGGASVEIKGDGVLHVYAFDTNYKDNSGVYEMKFRITRDQ